jgi:hypothetical protein
MSSRCAIASGAVPMRSENWAMTSSRVSTEKTNNFFLIQILTSRSAVPDRNCLPAGFPNVAFNPYAYLPATR